MEWYKDILINKNSDGPENIIYENHIYFRYMDRIYIPKEPGELNKNEVSWLSETRLKLADEIIDYDYSISVIDRLYELTKVKKNGSLIDFGCGGGMFLQYLKSKDNCNAPKQVLGLDISEYAIEQARNYYFLNGNNANISNLTFISDVFDSTGKINADDCSFDGAISSFVMHFKLYDHQMEELFRVLKPGANFCYNDYVYNKYPAHSKKVKLVLNRIGFEINHQSEAFKTSGGKNLKNHLIVTATKPIRFIPA
jgi:ubiquinone/menaquinone biosynthesis C-methylase UbiE